jgi:hypothetical protein
MASLRPSQNFSASVTSSPKTRMPGAGILSIGAQKSDKALRHEENGILMYAVVPDEIVPDYRRRAEPDRCSDLRKMACTRITGSSRQSLRR